MKDDEHRSIAVWLDPEQAPFVARVAEHAGTRVSMAGTPATGRAAEVANLVGAEPAGDLRELLLRVRSPNAAAGGGSGGAPAAGAGPRADPCVVDSVWLASLDTPGGSELESLLAAIRTCIGRGVPVRSSCPLPGSVLELAESMDRPVVASSPDSDATGRDETAASIPGEWPECVPRFRLSAPFIDARDCLDDFGPVGAAHMQSLGSWTEAGAGARLVDALDTIAFLFGEPEEVYATYTPAAGTTARHAPAKLAAGPIPSPSLEHVRHLRGTLAACMRFSDGRTASLLVSDASGAWARSLSLIGDGSCEHGGRLIVSGRSLEWIDRAGAALEERRRPPRCGSDGAVTEGVAAFAEALNEVSRARARGEPPLNHVSILAMAGAALLSATTGEPESPHTIRRMALSP